MTINRRAFLRSLLAGAALAAAGVPCGPASAAPGKTLIIYFSWSGNTRSIAKTIQQKLGCDIVELELERPYSSDYNTCLDEAQRDQQNEARPKLKTKIENLARYDTILLGYPNWWASIPMPIATLLESYDFSGKTIAPFCSHGGGRLGQSLTAIAKLAPKSKLTPGLSVHYGGGSSLGRDIDKWLDKNKLRP